MFGLASKFGKILPIAAIAATAFTFAPAVVNAQDAGAYALTASIARGGRLYDKWWAENRTEKPTVTHPQWPASNTRKAGDVTNRCKSCHGWDLKGVDGVYGSGSYQTGIKGLDNLAGADNAGVIASINNDLHGFGDALSTADYTDLANFITKGQYDVRAVINEDKTVIGDKANGQEIFDSVCAACHTTDGTKVDNKQMGESIGLVASGNPYEGFQKIRNGQPAENMPPLRAFGLQSSADLLAYIQTLPQE